MQNNAVWQRKFVCTYDTVNDIIDFRPKRARVIEKRRHGNIGNRAECSVSASCYFMKASRVVEVRHHVISLRYLVLIVSPVLNRPTCHVCLSLRMQLGSLSNLKFFTTKSLTPPHFGKNL